jgi:hypothetical protein
MDADRARAAAIVLDDAAAPQRDTRAELDANVQQALDAAWEAIDIKQEYSVALAQTREGVYSQDEQTQAAYEQERGVAEALEQQRLRVAADLVGVLAPLLRTETRRRAAALAAQQRERHLATASPALAAALEQEQVASQAAVAHVPALAAAYAQLEAERLAAAAEADAYERQFLEAVPAWAEARKRKDDAAGRLQALAICLTAVYEDRTAQERYEGAGLVLVWAKPAERTLGPSLGDIAADPTGLGVYLGLRKGTSAAPSVKVAPAKDK